VTQDALRVAWLGHKSAGVGDGIITYSRELTDGLRRRGVEVAFFHHGEKADRTELSEQAAEASLALEALPVSPQRWVITSPRSRRRLIDWLKRNRVDVVHVSYSFGLLDFELPRVCGQLGLPLVGTFHAPFDTRLSVWGGLSRTLYRLYAAPLSGCDAVIIFGETQRELLERVGVPARLIRVIPNGVDTDKYSPGPGAKRQPGLRRFLYMGRIDPEKNVEPLLTAFLSVAPEKGVRLEVMGGGAERRRLERRYRDPRIGFLGTVTDEAERIDWLRSSDVFILPSSIEGLSLAMLEAMACGVCTVATDVGTDGDALRGAGIVLDPAALPAELPATLRLLIEVPEVAELLGRAARRRVEERYSLERNIDSVLQLYREVVPGARV
jgi:glycosyltransferase involved in cell wall biosynthesis